ncbi:2-isopropylmalate synthase [Sediminicurvatus halobius]|uniref:2-isopropylmalate synthase n=1 Tax=Sediminicurvatus halobius TaxID=2182432 RepID=A0A2U2N3T3_9GAMM|nr:2-isopropylmalate synthase [Spiribacter halobius]PWG63871.1 2-isopropylmalate synthase [Spiribacter halobius]UEX76276.1 2-isopropylmalate synthase [Spiribacter halobius]
MLQDPSRKYRPYRPVQLADRSWPDQLITRPPVWMSTDLRDGNQALFEPMDAERKLELFRMLTEVGLREIEVGFPSASQTDYDFVRRLIDEDRIPEGVWIEVLTQARPELIQRTMEAVSDAPRVIVHVYNATSPVFREVVFGQDRDGVMAMAVRGARQIRELAEANPQTEWRFQYSPETFSTTELDFARDIVDAVTEVWEAGPERPVIINLPATVEMSTPNVFADQIEWMHRNLSRRDGIVLSVHPHNDRGTAVAAAELALMAGADRVEGCLFGNGERTGNVDLVTLALNLYTHGVHPGLDFSRINDVVRTVENCTRIAVHPRHPYVGDLVFTAFSGSHQDAIRKGFAVQQEDGPWQVPYLTIDPRDLGRTYESVIRVNSQSGKGGIAYLMEREYGLAMPRRLQVEFSQVVQAWTDDTGKEVRAEELWRIFEQEYLVLEEPVDYLGHSLFDVEDRQGIRLRVREQGREETLTGVGNGPIDALLAALDADVRVQHYEEHSMGRGSDARAVCFMELSADGVPGDVYGVGIHPNIVTASIRAVISGINRIWARLPADRREALFRAGERFG